MAQSFFFYDLETSGINTREDRIMQFAGQRTDTEFNPLGEPVNILIRLTPDILPAPQAVLLTGITPQQTLSDGMSEAEFLRYFYDTVVRPNTTFVGYNSIRFDDEFMRFLHYRNFYDAYEWQWRDGNSRWDLLDIVRMTRALRPEGINWPWTPEGKPTNRLGLLTKLNNLDHYKPHDALCDVEATIALARLLRQKQPKLLDYLFQIRKKSEIKPLIESGQPFMYTSSHYPAEYLHTTAAVFLTPGTTDGSAVVYDLRADPTPFMSLSVEEIVERWQRKWTPETPRLPLKNMKYNRCPAIAPGVAQDEAITERLGLSLPVVQKNFALLKDNLPDIAAKVRSVLVRLDELRAQSQPAAPLTMERVDACLYDGFCDPHDVQELLKIHSSTPATLTTANPDFHDHRLSLLLPLYKARNYPAVLTAEERSDWDRFRIAKLLEGKPSRLSEYFDQLSRIATQESPSDTQQYLLEELRLYGESIVPADVTD